MLAGVLIGGRRIAPVQIGRRMCGSNHIPIRRLSRTGTSSTILERSSSRYNNADPQTPSNPGSGDNPSDLFQQQLFQDDGGKPLFNFAKLNGSDQDNTFSSSLPLTPVMGAATTNTTTSNEPTPLDFRRRHGRVITSLPGQGFATVNLDSQGNTIEGAGAPLVASRR
jgi:hypothetical protein